VIDSERPVLVEVITHRFKGHSVSDPSLYRTRQELKNAMERDPLLLMQRSLMDAQIIDEEDYKAYEKEIRDTVIASMKYAEESPWPDPIVLGEDVFSI